MKYAPMVTHRELEKFVPNKVMNGDGRINRSQWEFVKTLATAYMDKDTHHSPIGGMVKTEVEELAKTLSNNKQHAFTDKQVANIKAALEDQMK